MSDLGLNCEDRIIGDLVDSLVGKIKSMRYTSSISTNNCKNVNSSNKHCNFPNKINYFLSYSLRCSIGAEYCAPI